jgi:hypothetical protein
VRRVIGCTQRLDFKYRSKGNMTMYVSLLLPLSETPKKRHTNAMLRCVSPVLRLPTALSVIDCTASSPPLHAASLAQLGPARATPLCIPLSLSILATSLRNSSLLRLSRPCDSSLPLTHPRLSCLAASLPHCMHQEQSPVYLIVSLHRDPWGHARIGL